MKKFRFLTKLAFVVCLSCTLSLATAQSSGHEQEAGQILNATSVKGGLIVHVGCGDGKLTAALCANESYLVHGLDSNADKVRQAWQYIRSLGTYGNVAVDRFDGKRLPYVDNLVNLVVAEDLGDVPMTEVMRVLCPNGVAYIKQDGEWKKTVKPWPKEIDEWTHYLHDATNNAVGHDLVVGPPRHLQWQAGPLWTRHHDFMSSLNAMVSAGGRLFYIIDEGPRLSIYLPPKWMLAARDAFSGVLLWKRPVTNWHTTLWRLKSGPAQLPRRLVAERDRVYVTLGADEPVTVLDAASGKVLLAYETTRGAEEILISNGVLFAVTDPNSGQEQSDSLYGKAVTEYQLRESPRNIVAVETATGAELWRMTSMPLPLSLTVDVKRVYFHDGQRIVSLDRSSGKRLWASEPISRRKQIPSWFGVTLVAYGDKVLFSGGAPGKKAPGGTGGNNLMAALSAETGKVLWTADHPPTGYKSPEDIFVIDDRVFVVSVDWRGGMPLVGYDLETGSVVTQFKYNPEVNSYIFPHHRCHRAKATDKYILMSQTGIEFVDLSAERWQIHHWVRGACLYGVMPANGLVYAPPHPCACYIETKLNGLNALAPALATRQIPKDIPDDDRLEYGPASEARGQTSQIRNPGDWPVYRRDSARSGFTPTSVPADLQPLWQAKLGGTLSAVTVCDGKVFVAEVDTHTVHALDARSGDKLWQFTTGGRIDSPPAIWQRRAYFGSADGRVYCVSLNEGTLIWRYLAAPQDLRMTAFGQVESVWPVHGSVLVFDGVVYCVAGRSMFLDGGMHLLRLDARTGRKLSDSVLDERYAGDGKNLQELVIPGLELNPSGDRRLKLWLPAALPDILSTDGENVYMRSACFTRDGKPIAPDLSGEYRDQKGKGVHLFSPTGFLDASGYHRSYWVFGKQFPAGGESYYVAGRWAPAGHILSFNDREVYGFGRKPEYYKWTDRLEHHLFAIDRDFEIAGEDNKASYGRTPTSNPAYRWTKDVPILVRAMVLAGKTLFIAGPRDLLDQSADWRESKDPQTQRLIMEQAESLEGKKGGLLWAVSVEDGRRLAELGLASPPVFDGMAAAHGRLYVSMKDGSLLCLAFVRQGKPKY